MDKLENQFSLTRGVLSTCGRPKKQFLISLSILLGVLAICSALNLQLSTALAQGTALCITNPTPAYDDEFGTSVAAVVTDRVLIGAQRDDTGATDAGAAYLFSTNGALLTTFTNPTPATGDNFGISVAAVGTDQVLIGADRADTGAQDAGAAYLLSTNSVLLTTFTNPTPTRYDFFGNAVAALGTDRVLIAAYGKTTGGIRAGAAYLFSTNGTLLATFNNPTPAANEFFGASMAAVGTDRVLIGATWDNPGATHAGAAYLFSTNGALLTTFNNPTPADYEEFGNSVAAVGADRVLIGAWADNTGASQAGAAYLFRTNGALLTTFTNPAPASGDSFGVSVATVGTDRVLIGAWSDDTGADGAGAAYLFSTNGTLLTTLTNPTPAVGDNFGSSVAAVGNDRVLIVAPFDNTGAAWAGAAYLFSVAVQTPEALSLTIRLTTTNAVAVSWPSPSTGWTLQQNTNGVALANWSNAPGTIQDSGTTKTLIINPPTRNRFFRLFKP
jgi:hypothetical protein